MDFISSAVVLWRFFAPYTVSQEVENRLARREKRASIAISFILFLLGFAVFVAAADDFSRGQEETEHLQSILGISIISIFVFGILAILKFHYSVRLSSPSLYKDGVCSLIGTVLAIALFVNTLIVKDNPQIWWLDPLVSMVAGVIAMVYGLYGVCMARIKEKLPICSIRWWFTSQGSKTDAEDTGDRPGPEHFTGSGVEMPEKDDDEGDIV